MENQKKIVPFLVFMSSLFTFYAGHWCYNLWQMATEESPGARFDWINTHINNYMDFYALDLRVSVMSIGIGLICFFIPWMIYMMRDTNTYRHGEEHGSARFATLKEYKPFMNEKFERNIILSQDIRKNAEKVKNFNFERNNMVTVIGGSGSGKSYSYVKPNLMQLLGSYIVTDPKGALVHETGKMFLDNGYQVRVFDLLSLANSHSFNPFKYIKTDAELRTMIELVIDGTDGSNARAEQPFWKASEKQVLTALLGYLHYSREEGAPYATLRDVSKLTPFLNDKVDEPEVPGILDILFEELEEKIGSENIAISSWKSFNANFQGETRVNVTSMPTTRFEIFRTPEIANLTSHDDMDIEKWGTEKYAVFITLPAITQTYNFLATIFIKQAFDTLVKEATYTHKKRGQSLPVQVRFMLDEFANLGKLPSIEKGFTNFRSYNIGLDMILQELAGIQGLYKDTWKSMVSNSDSFVYLGGNDKDDHKFISEQIGKQTITLKNHSYSRGLLGAGSNASGNVSVQKQGRELMMPEEVARLKNNESLVRIKGMDVYKGQKFNLESHPRFKEISDGNSEQWWDYKIGNEITDEEQEFIDSVQYEQEDEIVEIDVSEIIENEELEDLFETISTTKN